MEIINKKSKIMVSKVVIMVKSFNLLLRLCLQLKKELYIIVFISLFTIFYCVNPYVINPFEFTLYTNLIIPIGFIIWLFISLRIHLAVVSSIPLEWLKLNKVSNSPKKILFYQIILILILFIVLQLLICLIISSIIVIIFSSNIILFKSIFNLYTIYYSLPFLWAWLIGGTIGTLYLLHPYKQPNLYTIIVSLWILTVYMLEIWISPVNIIIDNDLFYIDPIINFAFLVKNTIFKCMLIIVLITVYGLFIKLKNQSIKVILSFMVIFFTTTTIYSSDHQTSLESELMKNDYSLFNNLNSGLETDLEIFNDWSVTGIYYEAESEYPLISEITLHQEKENIEFTLNEQFSISHIQSEDVKLSFDEKENVYSVETIGLEKLLIYYKFTKGTSFYPLTKEVTYLPYQANWYPQNNNITHYKIDETGSIQPNIQTYECEKVQTELIGNSFEWKGDDVNCLTLINGPYEKVKIQGTELVVYNPFLTKKENYINLKGELGDIKEELCTLIEKGRIERDSYCMFDINEINIIPKSINSSPISLYDSTITQGSYTFNVNLFLDVNYNPVTTYLTEIATILIPFRILENEEISLYISTYLIEKLDIKTHGQIEFLLHTHGIEDAGLDKFSQLSLIDKEKFIIQRLSELR